VKAQVPPARYAWPVAVALAAAAWYGAGSLRHRRDARDGYELQGELDVSGPGFLRAAEALTGAPISHGNEAELLINGDRIFPAFLETIEQAQRSLCLLTYVYWSGEVAEQVAGAIMQRAREGVQCRVLLDAVGAYKMDDGLVQRMQEAGVAVCRFRPPRPYALGRAANRTHRKVLVADGRVGLIGGVGIADEWTGDAQDPDHWRDTHVRVRGPVVRGLFGAFAENWLECTGDVLAGEDDLPELPELQGGGPMQVVRSRAGVGDTNVEALYFLAIAAAQESIDLTAAYFAPRPAFSDALCRAAGRGVGVRVLVPGPHIDKQFVRLAGRASYDELIDAGVHIFEYQPTMLHAKAMVVDRHWASVGSVNFDNRSFKLNDEATLCVQSDAFAGHLTDVFEADLERSEEIRPGRWRARGPLQRAQEAALKLGRREL